MTTNMNVISAPVLIVHDNPMIGENLVFLAGKMSLMTLVANNREEALEHYRQYGAYMVIACDHFGDGQTAASLFEKIENMGGSATLKIQVGGAGDKDTLLQAVESGADDIVPVDKIDQIFTSRLSIWIASGFQGIPSDLRRRALASLRAEEGQGRGLEDHITLDTTLLRNVLVQIQKELEAVSRDFGHRYIERMSFMARLSMLLIRQADRFEQFFRFPDLVYIISQGVNVDWRDEFPAMLAQFDHLALDQRFAQSGMQALTDQ